MSDCIIRTVSESWTNDHSNLTFPLPLLPPAVEVPPVTCRKPNVQSTAIEEELHRIDKQCEQQLLEERLLAIERCERRRMAEKKRI